MSNGRRVAIILGSIVSLTTWGALSPFDPPQEALAILGAGLLVFVVADEWAKDLER